MAEKWMQKAFSKNKGKFTAKAEKAGESVGKYASKVLKPGSKASTTTKREANLARTGARISRAHARGR
jgi:hypothetical protein